MVSAHVPPPLAFCDVAPCRSGRPRQSRHAAGNGRAECGGSRNAELSFEHIRPEQRARADFGLALVAVPAVLTDRSGNNGTDEILVRGFSKAAQRMTKKPRGRCLIGFVQNDTRTDRENISAPWLWRRCGVESPGPANGEGLNVNKLQDFANVFDGIKPWAGKVPRGYMVDFLGVLTDAKFRTMFSVDPATTGGRRRNPLAHHRGWRRLVRSGQLDAGGAHGARPLRHGYFRRVLRSAGGGR